MGVKEQELIFINDVRQIASVIKEGLKRVYPGPEYNITENKLPLGLLLNFVRPLKGDVICTIEFEAIHSEERHFWEVVLRIHAGVDMGYVSRVPRFAREFRVSNRESYNRKDLDKTRKEISVLLFERLNKADPKVHQTSPYWSF